MSIKPRRLEEREEIRTATEKRQHCLIFHVKYFASQLFVVTAVNEITATAWQTQTSLRKHVVIKVCSRNRISVANFQKLNRSQNYRVFNVRTIV